MPYARVQAIRESAGLLSKSENKKPTGAVDGTNRTFTVVRRPIVDSDYDDQVTTKDVIAYVNGTSVAITSVDPASGTILLTAAPAAGATVTIDHYFSPLTDSYVAGKAAEADSWVNLKIKASTLNPVPPLPLDPTPEVVSTAAELYAAGIILTRDYGSRVDSEQTSKDGVGKIKLAGQIIADYLAGAVADQKLAQSATTNAVAAVSDGDVFSRDEFADSNCVTDDDYFMRRQ